MRDPARIVVRCRTVEEHPEALEVVVLAMRLGRLTGLSERWELQAEVSVRDEGSGRVATRPVWLGDDLDCDVGEALREVAERAREDAAAGPADDGSVNEMWNVMLAWSARSTVDVSSLMLFQVRSSTLLHPQGLYGNFKNLAL